MPDIEIHFTEYFNGETVTISDGGRALYRGEPLKTDMRTSLAKTVRISVPDGTPTLTFELQAKGASASATLDVAELHHVSVSLADGDLKVTPVSVADYQREPRGYA